MDEANVEKILCDVCVDLWVEVEEASVAAAEIKLSCNCCSSCPGCSIGTLPSTDISVGSGDGERGLVNLAVTNIDEVVHTTCCQRTRLHAAAGWVVVDGLSAGVCLVCGRVGEEITCIATLVATIGVVDVEDESAWEAHWLDRDEFVGDEATEDAANDWERDVCEALDLAGRGNAAAAGGEAVALLEDLCCLVFEELRHCFTLEAVESTEEACAAPLFNESAALSADVTVADAFRELI